MENYHQLRNNICQPSSLIYYLATQPPSTESIVPVINSTLSSHKNKTAWAISSGLPRRPIGWKDLKSSSAAFLSPNCSNKPSTIGVTIVPGQIAFTRIPLLEYSRAILLVSCVTAPFVALYAATPGTAFNPSTEELFIIHPFPCFNIWGIVYLDIR